MAPIVRVEILLGAASHIRTCGYHDLLALTRHAKKRKKLLQHDQKSRDVYTKNPSCEDTSSKSPELVPFPRKAFLKLSGMGREHTGKRAQIERFISSALATVEHEEALSWIRGESFHRESQADRQARQRAKALGQFFSSSKNAKALVEWTLDRMSSRNSKKKEINLASWWFLEPSAGSGMVFDALPQGFSKSAIELDPTLAVSRSFLPQDFLTTTRTTLHTSLKIPPNHPLCVIGNPPFSAPKPTHVTPRQESHSQGHARREAEKKGCMCGDFGRGLGSDIAEAFICHALCCLEADVVSYILPNRCAKEDFVLGVRKRCHGMRSKKLGPLLLRVCKYGLVCRFHGTYQYYIRSTSLYLCMCGCVCYENQCIYMHICIHLHI
ncbi:hypothetical protein AAMO2058_000381000 [Amorphochlora amoebiformis]